MEKKILDVTCGARSIWFNKQHPAAVYCDKRREQYHHLWKNAGNCTLDIAPDVMCDFTALPFPDNSFPLVVFDPNASRWFSGVYAGFETRWCPYFQVVRVRHPGGRGLESSWAQAAVRTPQWETKPNVFGAAL